MGQGEGSALLPTGSLLPLGLSYFEPKSSCQELLPAQKADLQVVDT